MGIFHPFQSAIADGGDATLVQPSNWNAGHGVGLFETDVNGDMMPTENVSASFELDGNGDVEPLAGGVTIVDAIYELDGNGDIMPI
jgi:hypothetical protein